MADGYAQQDDKPDESQTKRGNGWPSDMKSEIDSSRRERVGDVMAWNICYRFLSNEQYLAWNRDRTSIVPLLPQAGQNATVTNMMLQHDRTVRSILETNMPRLLVKPTTASPDDITKAMASKEAMRWLWQETKLKKVLSRNNRWLMGSGNAALHVGFDPAQKRIKIEGFGGYDILFEPYAASYEEASWRAIRRIVTRQSVLDAYPKAREAIKDTPSLDGNFGQSERVFVARAPKDRIEIFECYNNAGKHGIWCGSAWIYEGETPGGVMPLIPYRYQIVEGRIYGIPMLFPLIDQQRAFNKFNNFMLDIADVCSNAPWLVPSTAQVNITQLRNDPRAVVQFNPIGGPPKRHEAPNVPAHLFEILNRFPVQMQDIAGVHPQTMGKRQGASSGVAIDSLTERDVSQLACVMSDIEDATAEALRVGLVFWQHFLPEAQQIAMLDQDLGRLVYKTLRGTDLVESPEIYVEPGTLFTITAQKRDDELMSLFQLGAIDAATLQSQLSFQVDQRDALKKFKALTHAQELLDAARQGQLIEIFPYDDLKAIQEVFEGFVTSPEYYAEQEQAQEAHKLSPNDETATMLANAIGIQDYLREILVAVQAPAQMSGQELKAIAATRVYPKPDLGPEAMQGGLPPGGQQQPQQGLPPTPPGPPKPAGRGTSGPVPNLQRPPGTGTTRGDPTQTSASNVRGGLG